MARRRRIERPEANKEFWRETADTMADWRLYYDRLTELSISMFEWQNVPKEIDIRYVELSLMADGHVVFFKDDVLDKYVCLRCAMGGDFDIYGIPTYRHAFAVNGYNCDLDADNSVIIWNNLLHRNSVLMIQVFAKRLWECDEIIDVNMRAQKTPALITCDESQRLTMKNVYQKYDGNVPVIFGDKNLNPNAIKVMKTDAPYVADDIYKLKTEYWNEALTYLGISNVNTGKKERMLTDEITRNLGGTIASRESRIQARKNAAKQINEMFGLNISVDFKEDYRVYDEDAVSDMLEWHGPQMKEGLQKSQSFHGGQNDNSD